MEKIMDKETKYSKKEIIEICMNRLVSNIIKTNKDLKKYNP